MSDVLTLRMCLELAGAEGLCQEAYKDGGGVWTWSIGVTDASGHRVERYIDKPQTIERCLEIYVWLLRTRYLPEVRNAFGDFSLSEAQLAAALSFHYNTGAIGTTNWVKLVKQGSVQAARSFLEQHYTNGGTLKARRAKEAALFFDGTWSGNGKVLVLPVRKPSYTPDFRHGVSTDVSADMAKALGQ